MNNEDQIKENELNEKPKFYENIAGASKVSRLDSGMVVGDDVFPIAHILEFDWNIVLNSTSQYITKTHNLGFRPLVLGSYILKSQDKLRVLGDVPDPDFSYFGNVWVDDVEIDDIRVGVNINGGDIEDEIHFKLFLLEQEAI